MDNEILPQDYTISMRKIQEMRYGENPHQKGAFYKALPTTKESCVSNAEQLHGKDFRLTTSLMRTVPLSASKNSENHLV